MKLIIELKVHVDYFAGDCSMPI